MTYLVLLVEVIMKNSEIGKISLAELLDALQQSWSQDTAMGKWENSNPSLNQCAVTALVVQDYLDGKLLRCETVLGNSHYWNLLPSFKEIDLTAEQFDFIQDKPIRETVIERSREYVLSYPDTARRYKTLANTVKKVLDNMRLTEVR
jgi:hypothetical protein